MNIQVNYRYTLLALPWIQQFWCMCGQKKKKPSEYKHWSKDSQLNPLKLILCWLFQVPVLSICKQYLNTFTTAALQVDNFSLIKKKTFISSFLVIMKGLEAKILSKWILNPWIFLNNTQNTFSIWTSIMNSELFWMGIASIVHTWPKNQWFPSLPFTSPEGSMSSPLCECEASDTQTVIVVFKDLVVLRQWYDLNLSSY